MASKILFSTGSTRAQELQVLQDQTTGDVTTQVVDHVSGTVSTGVTTDSVTGEMSGLSKALAAMGVGLGLERVVFVGDSMTAGNLLGFPITSAVRANGVVTIVTSSDLAIDTGMYGSTSNIVPEDMNANNVRFTKTATNTYTYEAPGANGSGASLGESSKPMYAMNPQQQIDYVAFWLKSKTSGAFSVERIYGNLGNTATDMLRRIQSGEIDFSGATQAILQTGYNDFVNESRTAEDVFADMKAAALLAQARVPGLKVTIEGALPWKTGGGNINRANAARYNRLLMNYCASAHNIRYANSAALLVDATHATAFYPKENMLGSDGIHSSPRGAERRAEAIYLATSGWFPPVDRLVCSAADNYGFDSSSKNIFDSGPWENSGGTVTAPATGVAAPSFTVSTQASVTTVASVPARADGLGYDQQIESTSAGTSIVSTISMGSIAGSRYAPGDKFILSAELSLSGVSASKLRGINMYATLGPSVQYIVRSGAADNAKYPQNDMTLKVFSEPLVVPDVKAANITITTNFIFHAAGTALTAKIGRVSMVKIV